MIYDITHAIASLRPGAVWIIHSEDYNTLEWSEENTTTKPTLEEIEQEVIRLQEAYDNKEYQRLRAAEYPDFKDYLDGVVKGDQAQIQAYIDACLAVKIKYPKP